MTILKGSCGCKNISFKWSITANVLLKSPRACQCSYCCNKQASYLSDANSELVIQIQHNQAHDIQKHGTGTADFHECSECGDLVVVTSMIDGNLYAVVNAKTLEEKTKLLPPAIAAYERESRQARLARRKRNWIAVVKFT